MNRKILETTLTRAAFLRRCALVSGGALIDPRRPLSAVLSTQNGRQAREHPDPRPDITSERVLSAATLKEKHASARATRAYEAARQWPQLFDGIACGCGCIGVNAHRSLLSCYETTQPIGCAECRERAAPSASAEVVARAQRGAPAIIGGGQDSVALCAAANRLTNRRNSSGRSMKSA